MLAIKPAVRKEEAEKLAEEGVEARSKKRFDRRHTHLAYEGNVRAGSDVAAAMPASDLAKREAAAKEKKVRREILSALAGARVLDFSRAMLQEKLKSPLFFVSPTRLSIRNLARSVDDATLRLLCIKATAAGLKARLVKAGEGDPELMPPKGTPPAERVALKSSRVMREGAGGREEGGAPRSKGFAFVEFTSHLHALTCLRALNNNPAYSHHAAGGAAVRSRSGLVRPPPVATPSLTHMQARTKPEAERPRLIVEFVLENLAKKRLHEQKVAERREREGILTSSGLTQRPRFPSGGASQAGGGGMAARARPTSGSGPSAPGVLDTARLPGSALAGAKRPRGAAGGEASAAPAFHPSASARAREGGARAVPPPRSTDRAPASAGRTAYTNPRDRVSPAAPRTRPAPPPPSRSADIDAGITRALGGDAGAPGGASGTRRAGRKRAHEEDAQHEALVRGYTRNLAERSGSSGPAKFGRAASGSNTVDTGGRLAARRLAAVTLFGAGGAIDPKWTD